MTADAPLTHAEKVAAIKGICKQSRAAKAAGATLYVHRHTADFSKFQQVLEPAIAYLAEIWEKNAAVQEKFENKGGSK